MRAAHIESFIAFHEGMSPETVDNISDFYTADAYFKDPFNEVTGVGKIEDIFRKMFHQVEDPHIVVRHWSGDERDGFVVWDLCFRSRRMRGGDDQVIHGVSHIRFDMSGKATYHRDYWDTGEELYAKLPLIGGLIRWLQRRAG